ncbi:zinc-ribbon domain-containing protein [Pendulispora albinea]|uniref:Zinc-ribbon domain-containing protein n=1 Tax=Pendulispora albinea TaxID=2741071 RepID=A0ABZ2MC88_9BACT
MKPPISKFPKLVREWHPTRNGELTPGDVSAGSERRIWWRCSKDGAHEWQAVPIIRAKGSGCPYCSGRRATAQENVAALFPEVARQWHPSKNGALKPQDVRPASTKRVWWRCAAGRDHEWEATVASRCKQGTRCPFCAGRRLSETNTLARCAPKIARQWHPTKNGRLTPASQIATAWQLRWWQCPKGSDHMWRDHVYSRVEQNAGCPFCYGRRVSTTNSLAHTAPEIARLWHPTKNGRLTPHRVTWGSGRRVWWKCPEGIDHEWQCAIANRSAGTECPFCMNKRVSVTNSLETLDPQMAGEWHPSKNGKLTPRDVTCGSGKVVWWRCERGHSWRTRIAHRTGVGSGCPTCEFMSRRGRPPTTRRRLARSVRLPSYP